MFKLNAVAMVLTFSVGCAPGNDVGATQAALWCFNSCQSADECSPGEQCYDYACRMRPLTAHCMPGNVSQNDAGDRNSCENYTCDPASGYCRRSCTSSTDCASGASCEIGSGRCLEVAADGGKFWGVTDLPRDPERPVAEGGGSGDCPPFTCERDEECWGGAPFYMCHNHVCLPYTRHCVDEHRAWIDAAHVVHNCGEFRCDDVHGECWLDCLSSEHCAPGFTCDLDRQACVSG